uniref:Uncharacterized protein n=1 Tax=Eutreptiella gymnastica TaxID=73025 RepID=A0A6T2BEW1_9EUGL|eukprot:CAMPEP_0174300508 /NCGR_PEP_ID=MMETSP0809-20121228/58499_1 /TAXON_ID=73025 ORGANISM="Eutreptiella gymnastica-like, Strain CCMP1594" /NCGR_SAMPLE_ID=MMETSP0809 /ASSEMBLY_ACC=CAM_ASM_000658 /LENGTH=125 /DNA_ID=CAMNT_0015406087 /DNA_START=384 /DNA_END=761 /DNA_ORIENTATION=-
MDKAKMRVPCRMVRATRTVQTAPAAQVQVPAGSGWGSGRACESHIKGWLPATGGGLGGCNANKGSETGSVSLTVKIHSLGAVETEPSAAWRGGWWVPWGAVEGEVVGAQQIHAATCRGRQCKQKQ